MWFSGSVGEKYEKTDSKPHFEAVDFSTTGVFSVENREENLFAGVDKWGEGLSFFRAACYT